MGQTAWLKAWLACRLRTEAGAPTTGTAAVVGRAALGAATALGAAALGWGGAAAALAAALLAAFAAAATDASMLLCPRLDKLSFALHTMQL